MPLAELVGAALQQRGPPARKGECAGATCSSLTAHSQAASSNPAPSLLRKTMRMGQSVQVQALTLRGHRGLNSITILAQTPLEPGLTCIPLVPLQVAMAESARLDY